MKNGIVGQSNAMSPKAVMAAMHVNPQQKQQLERIVAAGMKVLFDKSTHQMMIDAMQGDGPIEQKLGQGIVRLIGVLWSESKGSIPPELLIPAGMVLLAEAADFMNQAGQTVTPEQFGKANEIMLDTLLQQAGVSSDKLAEKGGQPAPRAGALSGGQQPAPGAVA